MGTILEPPNDSKTKAGVYRKKGGKSKRKYSENIDLSEKKLISNHLCKQETRVSDSLIFLGNKESFPGWKLTPDQVSEFRDLGQSDSLTQTRPRESRIVEEKQSEDSDDQDKFFKAAQINATARLSEK